MTRATLAKIFTSLDDRPKRKPSRDELILLYMPMVERIARRECRKQRSYGKQFLCLEDIRGELTVNLIRLIDRYEEGRSDSLEAYLAQYLGEWRAVDAVEKSQAIRDTHEINHGAWGLNIRRAAGDVGRMATCTRFRFMSTQPDGLTLVCYWNSLMALTGP
jgi:hypothetical protein